jgi:hypothetical protein
VSKAGKVRKRLGRPGAEADKLARARQELARGTGICKTAKLTGLGTARYTSSGGRWASCDEVYVGRFWRTNMPMAASGGATDQLVNPVRRAELDPFRSSVRLTPLLRRSISLHRSMRELISCSLWTFTLLARCRRGD